ncbi:Mvp1p [Sugiyamaella lignohabitans]|uniref:Sorting nexin MVP1 n=1 Tax=Sugiyamaella lignohabitans TaxID=796027 RepID=A0A161HIR2_9ASCO|nr:Mvp1p [Sugiyamaella lignohabitans]ANB14969.1 Mvp1p [Sugiyamaella lignohabitans]
MSLFGDDNDLFGRASGPGGGNDDDLWSLPQPKGSSKDRISSLLAGVSVPQSYDELYNRVRSSDGRVGIAGLEDVIGESAISVGTGELIVNLVTKGKSNQSLDRDSWNVAMALVGLAQAGEDDLGLDAVDFSRDNLPEVSLPRTGRTLSRARDSSNVTNGGNVTSNGNNNNNYSSSGNGGHHGSTLTTGTSAFSRESSIGSEYQSAPPTSAWGSDQMTDPSLTSSSPVPSLPLGSSDTNPGSSDSGAISAPWSNSASDPNNYNPTSKDTITITLAPEREGIFMFRHVVYNLEGTINYSEYSNTPKTFKVVRRYSNFLWLQDCLVKKYPFRLLAVLPPKRLAVDGRYLSSDSYFLERRRRGLSRFINQIIKHPLLRKDKLVVMFLTVDTEPSVWQKQASLKIEEEFAHRIISPAFVAKWNQDEETARWRAVNESAILCLEAVTQLCFIADRVSRRQDAMSADYNKMSQSFSSLAQNIGRLYSSQSGDIPVINAGIGSAIKYTSTTSALLRDESQSVDIGFLEELKQLREFLTSFKVSDSASGGWGAAPDPVAPASQEFAGIVDATTRVKREKPRGLGQSPSRRRQCHQRIVLTNRKYLSDMRSLAGIRSRSSREESRQARAS